jgi:hypothetical protein
MFSSDVKSSAVLAPSSLLLCLAQDMTAAMISDRN